MGRNLTRNNDLTTTDESIMDAYEITMEEDSDECGKARVVSSERFVHGSGLYRELWCIGSCYWRPLSLYWDRGTGFLAFAHTNGGLRNDTYDGFWRSDLRRFGLSMYSIRRLSIPSFTHQSGNPEVVAFATGEC